MDAVNCEFNSDAIADMVCDYQHIFAKCTLQLLIYVFVEKERICIQKYLHYYKTDKKKLISRFWQFQLAAVRAQFIIYGAYLVTWLLLRRL